MTSISSLTQSLSKMHFEMQKPYKQLGTIDRRELPLPSQDRGAVLNTYGEIITSLSKKTIPASDLKKYQTSTLEKVQYLINQGAYSRLEYLSLPPYDLPPKLLHALLDTHSSSLDRLKEEYAIAIRSHSPQECTSHLSEAYHLSYLPCLSSNYYISNKIPSIPLPLKTHQFFHAHACGRQIQDGKELGKGSFGKIRQGTLDEMSFATKTPCLDYQKHLEDRKANNEAPLSKEDFLKNLRDFFVYEFYIHMKLNHPNIIKVFANRTPSKSGEKQAIFLELAFETLLQFFVRNKPKNTCFFNIEMQKRLKIFSQIASALAHMHSKGIIHNDLTLNNVLLTEDCTVKVADFGLATLQSNLNCRIRVDYISPPECLDPAVISDKCDIWAFGVLLYISFKDSYPYPKTIKKNGLKHKETNQEYRQRLHNAFYEKTAEVSPLFQESGWEERDPDGFWRALIADCLNPLPEKRPSAREIYEHLKQRLL